MPDSFIARPDTPGTAPLCLSPGMGTLYEAFARTRPEGAVRSFWMAKAETQYEAIALRRQGNADGTNAAYETDERGLAFLRVRIRNW